MTIGEFIKEYRQKNGLSQREFAKILGVADMTVSRIEAGQNYISSKVADSLSDLMDESDFARLDEQNPLVIKLKRAFLKKESEINDKTLFTRLSSRVQRMDLCEKIDALLLANGFTVVENLPNDKHLYDRLYFNELTQKQWVFFFPVQLSQSNGFIGTDAQLFAAIGYAHLAPQTNIRKVTVIMELRDVYAFNKSQTPSQLQELPCDFSIVPYCADDFLHTEIDLSLLGDGRGLFDMDSPDADIRAREIERFSKWKRSLL